MFKLACSHFPSCSGCSYELSDCLPLFLKDFPFPLEIVSKDLTKWRMRSKLAIRGTNTAPLIGLFKKGSHTVLPIPLCLVHHPLINKTVRIVEELSLIHI